MKNIYMQYKYNSSFLTLGYKSLSSLEMKIPGLEYDYSLFAIYIYLQLKSFNFHLTYL